MSQLIKEYLYPKVYLVISQARLEGPRQLQRSDGVETPGSKDLYTTSLHLLECRLNILLRSQKRKPLQRISNK